MVVEQAERREVVLMKEMTLEYPEGLEHSMILKLMPTSGYSAERPM
jgi:hypothetical protein